MSNREVREPLDILESVELLTRAKRGEAECAEELFRRYRSRLLRIARQTLGANPLGCDPSDLVQSTLRRAARDLDRFEPEHERAIGAWFSAIMTNTVREKWRRERTAKRGNGVGPQQLDESIQQGPAHNQPKSILEDLAQDELIARVWSSLSPAEHELVQLRLAQGLPWDEVAIRIGSASPDSARRKFSMLLARLRGKLAKDST